ncbi:MAG: DUF4214 domain-containing protein [Microcoleus vaginatus WJT46-NPBG5]|jgi:uncharacterized protein (UPF0335 family)|nr:DUF4214 domain-containing protein [Microcoleus vaginatus WJT46-NPBG5]
MSETCETGLNMLETIDSLMKGLEASKMKGKILASAALLFTMSLAAPVKAANAVNFNGMLASQDCQMCGVNSPALIAQSSDDRQVYDAINRIYREVLGRDADYRGLRTWARELENGGTLQDIREEIARSDEAENRIEDIYREVLGRNADSRGTRTWVNALAGGASLRDVRERVADSREAEDAINRLYREVLGRDADRKGMKTWKRELGEGASLTQIRREIGNSAEARQRRRR